MIRSLLKFLCLAVVVGALATVTFAILASDPEPLVADGAAPTPEDVAEARAFVRGVRAAIQADPATPQGFDTTQAQLNSVIKLGARFIPGFRGQVAVADGAVEGRASIPLPYTNRGRWLNLRAIAPGFEGRLQLSRVEVGGIPLPPELTLQAGRIGANLVFGNDLGDTALESATAMRVGEKTVSFDLAMDQLGQNGLMRGVFGTLRGAEMPDAADIERYSARLRTAMARGELPREGSFLPYLTFTLDAALEGSRTEGVANAYTSAIFALARVCGARDFTMVVGSLADGETEEDADASADCSALTLNGRIDSRRHFTTAAAIQAASNRGFAVSVGEFKELYDTVKAGGFDFTDLAANNSGIRLSNTFMRTPAEAWPALIARIEDERDVIVSYEGIPQIISGDAFRAQYGDVDSAEYHAMLERIEARIDDLPVHGDAPGRP